MDFSSDNSWSASPEILAAMAEANAASAPSYGGDEWTKRLIARMSDIFEREVAVFPVATGTAANALSIATLCPSHGAVFCYENSHIAYDECGAPEFYSGGAKLIGLGSDDGKITPAKIEEGLSWFRAGDVHQAKPSLVSITEATELGTVYTPGEIAAIAACARPHGMKLHMDGARFANALARLGCAPAEMTWKAGVDALSFGATKNGGLNADAVVLFDAAAAQDFAFRRMKGGHLMSKMRFAAAQLLAYLENDLWLRNARRANRLAARMADSLSRIPGIAIGPPAEANAVFAYFPDALIKRLRDAGARFHPWEPGKDGRTLMRLVLSPATPEEDVERFLEAAAKSVRPA